VLGVIGSLCVFAAPASQAAAPSVREDCAANSTCGWKNAYFATKVFTASGTVAGNYNTTGAAYDSISAIRNGVSSTKNATYFYSQGSNTKVCLRPNYEVGNLAGSALQDHTRYVQVSGYSC